MIKCAGKSNPYKLESRNWKLRSVTTGESFLKIVKRIFN